MENASEQIVAMHFKAPGRDKHILDGDVFMTLITRNTADLNEKRGSDDGCAFRALHLQHERRPSSA
jgi:hypothetical protein